MWVGPYSDNSLCFYDLQNKHFSPAILQVFHVQLAIINIYSIKQVFWDNANGRNINFHEFPLSSFNSPIDTYHFSVFQPVSRS